MPKYMMLIYASTDQAPPADPAAQGKRWSDYTQSLRDAGALLGDNRLAGVDAATTVRMRDGEMLITDGPFAETNEFLAGYYLLECPDLDEALAHAARVPNVGEGSVEVRPVVTVGGAPEGA